MSKTREWPPPPAHQRPCGRCGHQQGCHTGGASTSGWAIYEPTWVNAAGWCSVPGCDCPARVPEQSKEDPG